MGQTCLLWASALSLSSASLCSLCSSSLSCCCCSSACRRSSCSSWSCRRRSSSSSCCLLLGKQFRHRIKFPSHTSLRTLADSPDISSSLYYSTISFLLFFTLRWSILWEFYIWQSVNIIILTWIGKKWTVLIENSTLLDNLSFWLKAFLALIAIPQA